MGPTVWFACSTASPHVGASQAETVFAFRFVFVSALLPRTLSLVFEDLTRKEDGAYSVGLPDKIELWDQWMSSVEAAVKGMHAAGVVHVDLYPSNIMWRKSPDASGGVEIKLIDFDVAHLKDEGTWKEEVYVKMKEVAANRSRFGWSVTKEVSEDWDNQYIKVCEGNTLRKLNPKYCEPEGSVNLMEIRICTNSAPDDGRACYSSFRLVTVLHHLVTAATKNEDSIEESIRDGLTSGKVHRINFAFQEFVKVTDICTL